MVYVLLGNGFEEIETIAPVDILRRGGVDVKYAGVADMTAVGAHGVEVGADVLLADINFSDMDMLVLPGGRVTGEGNYGSSEKAKKIIIKAFKKNIPVGAICAGPTVLAGMGLIEGLRCTCYPGMENMLAGAVHVKEAKVVRDGELITGQGPGAALDFGFNLLAFLRGTDTAEAVREQMHYTEVKYVV